MNSALAYFDPSKILAGFDAGVKNNYDIANANLAYERGVKQNQLLDENLSYTQQANPIALSNAEEANRRVLAGQDLFNQNNDNALKASRALSESNGIAYPTVDDNGGALTSGQAEEMYIAKHLQSADPLVQARGRTLDVNRKSQKLAQAIKYGDLLTAGQMLNDAGLGIQITENSRISNADGSTMSTWKIGGRIYDEGQARELLTNGAANVAATARQSQDGLLRLGIQSQNAKDLAASKLETPKSLAELASDPDYQAKIYAGHIARLYKDDPAMEPNVAAVRANAATVAQLRGMSGSAGAATVIPSPLTRPAGTVAPQPIKQPQSVVFTNPSGVVPVGASFPQPAPAAPIASGFSPQQLQTLQELLKRNNPALSAPVVSNQLPSRAITTQRPNGYGTTGANFGQRLGQ